MADEPTKSAVQTRGQQYRAVRATVTAWYERSTEHMISHTNLVAMITDGADDITLALLPPPGGDGISTPMMQVLLGDMPAGLVSDLLMTLTEYHKVSLQQADRELAKAATQLAALHDRFDAAPPDSELNLPALPEIPPEPTEPTPGAAM